MFHSFIDTLYNCTSFSLLNTIHNIICLHVCCARPPWSDWGTRTESITLSQMCLNLSNSIIQRKRKKRTECKTLNTYKSNYLTLAKFSSITFFSNYLSVKPCCILIQWNGGPELEWGLQLESWDGSLLTLLCPDESRPEECKNHCHAVERKWRIRIKIETHTTTRETDLVQTWGNEVKCSWELMSSWRLTWRLRIALKNILIFRWRRHDIIVLGGWGKGKRTWRLKHYEGPTMCTNLSSYVRNLKRISHYVSS